MRGPPGLSCPTLPIEPHDPYEMRNLIDESANEEIVQSLMHYAWQRIKETNDQALLDSHYPVLRLAPYGPNIIDAG